MLSPLWKQQIYAWSWTGKNWTLLPVGILPWRAAGSDEIFHPDQIREYSTMSVFLQEALLSSEREPGLSWVHPRMFQTVSAMRGREYFGYILACILWIQCARVRSPVWTLRGGFLHHATMLCLVVLRSRGKTCVSSHLFNKSLSDSALPVHNPVLSSVLALGFS